MNMKIVAAAVVVIIALAAVAGIAMNNGGNDHKNNDSSDDDYYANGITVNDRIASSTTDNVLTFNHKPTKVFVCIAANVELMCSLGLEDYIVGAYVRTTDDIPLNEEYADSYSKILSQPTTKVGALATWSKEYVMQCDPEVIIGWSGIFTDSKIGTVDYWNQYGIQCIKTNQYGNGSGSSLDTYYQLLDMMGKIWNVSEKTDAKIAELKDKQAAIAEKIKGLSDSEKPRVLVMDYKVDADGKNIVYGTDMLTGKLIEAAGGVCVSSGRMTTMTFEEIAKTGADFVMMVGYVSAYTHISDEEVEKVKDWFESIPVFAAMEIPREKVTALPFYTMYMAGVLDEDVMDKMFALMYPDLANA